jgi:protein-L-isoaspartate(D-aspartate) O-methyltransferase
MARIRVLKIGKTEHDDRGGDAPAWLTARRRELRRAIEAEARILAPELGREGIDERVLDAMLEVPREEFVASELRRQAYENHPLPIGYAQTISQPLIVALMTDMLRPAAEHRILEVGTGSGYQAAVLSHLVRRVYSIEVIPELASQARDRLHRLGYANVEVRCADGYAGWPEHAPYDGIVVTAAARNIPPPLLDQLACGGRLVIPVDRGGWRAQDLVIVSKDDAGSTATRSVLPVAFVPLTTTREAGRYARASK